MISYIKGTIQNKGRGYVIVLVRDLGYKVFVNDAVYSELDIGQSVEFYTFHNIKEEASDLYGFYHMEQLNLFEILLSISGVGPKSALGVLGVAGVEQIKETIASGDSSLLTKVSGIGKKTAERMVLELRDKVGGLAAGEFSSGGAVRSNSDEIDALMALGYSLLQAREALRKVDPKTKDSGERIRQALRAIGN